MLNLWQKLLQKTTVQKVIIYIMRNEQGARLLANVSIQEAIANAMAETTR